MHIRQPGLFSFAHRFSNCKFRPVSDTNTQQKSTFIICTKKEMGYSSQKLVKFIQKKEHGLKKVFLDEVPFPRGKGDVQQQSPSVALRCWEVLAPATAVRQLKTSCQVWSEQDIPVGENEGKKEACWFCWQETTEKLVFYSSVWPL